MRRPGLLIATIFALGALFGLVSNSLFLRIEATEIRTAAEERASSEAGPIAGLMLSALDERDVFGRIAADIRADQIRSLQVAGAAAVTIAVGLGALFSRRAVDARTRGNRGRPNRDAGRRS